LDTVRFAVGSEESGHTITMGSLTTANGLVRPVFIGNGIKSAINTFAATWELARRHERDRYVEHVIHPFKPGWKRTLYVYYTDKDKLKRGTELWKELEQVLTKVCGRHFGKGLDARQVPYVHEPDLLYAGLYEGEERIRASVFCRNSGTEDKTGIVLRGPEEDAERLAAVGDELRRLLLLRMKARAHPLARAELAVLRALFDRGKATRESIAPLVGSAPVDRLLDEMLRQELVEKEQDVYTLTDVGRWYMEASGVGKSSHPEG